MRLSSRGQNNVMTSLLVLSCRAENLVIVGEETNVQSPRKTSLGHLRAVKQLLTVALDLKRRRVDSEAFQSIQLDIYSHFAACRNFFLPLDYS